MAFLLGSTHLEYPPGREAAKREESARPIDEAKKDHMSCKTHKKSRGFADLPWFIMIYHLS